MASTVCGSSLFGPSSQYIKLNAGDFIAVEGANTRERLITSDLRIPYKQLLKSRIILKPGQVNYLLNHLGLGDNATFVAIKALYDPKSVIEEDNYVQWNFYNDFSKIYPMAQLLVLTGNSTNRVQQLYLTNPNPNYPVYLDVMAAVIDDQYSFFEDTTNQSGLSFTGLKYTDILTHVVNESIVLMSSDMVPSPIAYIMLSRINSIERLGRVLIIDDTSVGKMFLEFISDYEAQQANSVLSWVMEAPDRIIQDFITYPDDIPPVVYFTPMVYVVGSTYSGTFSTAVADNFSATMSLSTYGGTSSQINISTLRSLLIATASDNRDGYMILTDNNVILHSTQSLTTLIDTTGTYSLTFDLSDIAVNFVSSNENILITVIP